MKIAVCLVVVTIAVGAQALTDAQNQNYRNECERKTGVCPNELKKQLGQGQRLDESKVSKYLLCYLTKIALIDENGNLAVNDIKLKVKTAAQNDEDAQEIIEKCAVKKETPEKTVFNLFNCMYQNKPALQFA